MYGPGYDILNIEFLEALRNISRSHRSFELRGSRQLEKRGSRIVDDSPILNLVYL